MYYIIERDLTRTCVDHFSSLDSIDSIKFEPKTMIRVIRELVKHNFVVADIDLDPNDDVLDVVCKCDNRLCTVWISSRGYFRVSDSTMVDTITNCIVTNL